MQLDMEDFKTSVKRLAEKPESASVTVGEHPTMDSLHVYEFGYLLEDQKLVEDADSVFDISINEFNKLLEKLPE